MSRPLRVLLVEDDPEDVPLLLRELERAGYDVLHQRVDTEAGLRAALSGQEWDVVLTDCILPGFDGREALRIVRSRGRTCRWS